MAGDTPPDHASFEARTMCEVKSGGCGPHAVGGTRGGKASTPELSCPSKMLADAAKMKESGAMKRMFSLDTTQGKFFALIY